jgi:hypothetical protein
MPPRTPGKGCVFPRTGQVPRGGSLARPHGSLDLKPPDSLARQLQIPHSPTALVERRDRLGGLIHEYRAAA